MTHATIRLIDPGTISVEFPFSDRHKTAVKAIPGAEWHTPLWTVPLCRLSDVVKIFMPNVSLDYTVLAARDAQLARVFRQYMAMGVQFDVVKGKVVSDHRLLNEWLQAHSTVLHVNALALARRPRVMAVPVYAPSVEVVSTAGERLLMRGIQGAVKAREKKEGMKSNVRNRNKSRAGIPAHESV